MTIQFNEGNLIPVYQKQYPLYDRFLPHLAKYLTGTIIDVGANCGDVACRMGMNNPNLDFICIEPEEKLWSYILDNTSQIDNRVHLVKERVGVQNKWLDDILDKIKVKDIGLLKIDIDGYDWDAIKTFSFETKPPIYIEEDIKESWQFDNYIEMNNRLEDLGYNNIWIFDNYGCFMRYTNSWAEVNDLLDYTVRMKKGQSSMTFYYNDLLICQDADIPRLHNAVKDYLYDGS